MVSNIKSVQGMEDVVWEEINKEKTEVRVLGPFKEPPIPTFQIFLLGIMPKKTSGGGGENDKE